jgi:hypothetical protein
MLGGMSRFAKLQFAGPFVLFIATLSAECAAYALGVAPSSDALWYINLELFGLFQKTHYLLNAYVDVAYFQLLCVALPLFVVASYGLLCKRALALAIACNLGCVYAGVLLYAAFTSPVHSTASLVSVAVSVSAPSDVLVGLILFGCSLLSFLVSHISYAGLLRKGAHARQPSLVLGDPDAHRRRPVLRSAD